MAIFYLKYDYAGWGNLYHKVVADTKSDAIKKFIKGTRVPESKVHVWKGNGLPKRIAGRNS